MTATIRLITEADKPQWVELWHKYLKFYASTGIPSDLSDTITDTTFARFLDDKEPMACFVAEDDETHKLVGFANFLWHRNTWAVEDRIYLNDLFVDESVRSGGIGRKLIEAIYKYGDDHGMPSVYWMTQVFNHRAQLLYTKAGVRDGFVTYSRP